MIFILQVKQLSGDGFYKNMRYKIKTKNILNLKEYLRIDNNQQKNKIVCFMPAKKLTK